MDFLPGIDAFLTGRTVVPLVAADAGETLTKCGLLPFLREKEMFHFYVMRPRARHPELGLPEYQICKGTRRYFDGTDWRDIRSFPVPGEAESLPVTALREGQEEIGLVLDNISRLFDSGEVAFSSASTGDEKRMRLFLAEVRDPARFTPIAPGHPDTSEARWLSHDAFRAEGRADHVRIADLAAELLLPHL